MTEQKKYHVSDSQLQEILARAQPAHPFGDVLIDPGRPCPEPIKLKSKHWHCSGCGHLRITADAEGETCLYNCGGVYEVCSGA